MVAIVASCTHLSPAIATEDESFVRRRARLVGTTPDVRARIAEGVRPYRGELNSETVEYGKPPPPCGVMLQRSFARYCVKRLRIALAGCEASQSQVHCSSDYLEPRDAKVFWRLSYRHEPDRAILELEALRRGPSGRADPVAPSLVSEFDELYELLVMTSRCDLP